MTGCIFCRILSHEAPGSFVLETPIVAAFMDIHQPNPYKVLVVPRAHVEMIYDLGEADSAAIMQTAVRIARAIRTVSQCDGMSVFQSNGEVAGQEVPHFHLHLVPRHNGDQGTRRVTPETRYQHRRSELDRMAAALSAALER